MKKQAEGKQKVAREGKAFKEWESKKADVIKKTEDSFFAAMGKPEDNAHGDSDRSGLEDESYREKSPETKPAEPQVSHQEEHKEEEQGGGEEPQAQTQTQTQAQAEGGQAEGGAGSEPQSARAGGAESGQAEGGAGGAGGSESA